MSCYEWEEGTIQLPKARFAGIKKSFIDAYNYNKEMEYEACKRLRDHVLTINKGKRNVDWLAEMFNHASRFGVTSDSVHTMVVDNKKPKAMTRKALEFATGKTVSFHEDEAGVHFNKTSKTVTWSVEENNHAVETARNTKLGCLFFRTMSYVQWTRGSGGEIVGNDEYNCDNVSSGGGGNYTTQTFGK